MDTRSPGYTKTGNNFAAKLSNFGSYIPIPFIGEAVSAFAGAIGALIDAGGWLLRGKVLSAVTALTTGTVETTVNAMVSGPAKGINPFYWLNVGSGLITGRTLGTHARKLTEVGIGAVTKPLGVQPTVLRSYPAGIGSINGGMAAAGRNNGFVAAEAGRRGESSRDAWARINSNQSDHVAELEAARAQGAQLSR
jgi:hypothetical protein